MKNYVIFLRLIFYYLIKVNIFGILIFLENIKELFFKRPPKKKSIFFEISTTPKLSENKNTNYFVTKFINNFKNKEGFYFYLINKKKNIF